MTSSETLLFPNYYISYPNFGITHDNLIYRKIETIVRNYVFFNDLYRITESSIFDIYMQSTHNVLPKIMSSIIVYYDAISLLIYFDEKWKNMNKGPFCFYPLILPPIFGYKCFEYCLRERHILDYPLFIKKIYAMGTQSHIKLIERYIGEKTLAFIIHDSVIPIGKKTITSYINELSIVDKLLSQGDNMDYSYLEKTLTELNISEHIIDVMMNNSCWDEKYMPFHHDKYSNNYHITLLAILREKYRQYYINMFKPPSNVLLISELIVYFYNAIIKTDSLTIAKDNFIKFCNKHGQILKYEK